MQTAPHTTKHGCALTSQMAESGGNERGDSRSIINIHITALAETRAEEEQAAGDAAVAAEPNGGPPYEPASLD